MSFYLRFQKRYTVLKVDPYPNCTMGLRYNPVTVGQQKSGRINGLAVI